MLTAFRTEVRSDRATPLLLDIMTVARRNRWNKPRFARGKDRHGKRAVILVSPNQTETTTVRPAPPPDPGKLRRPFGRAAPKLRAPFRVPILYTCVVWR